MYQREQQVVFFSRWKRVEKLFKREVAGGLIMLVVNLPVIARSVGDAAIQLILMFALDCFVAALLAITAKYIQLPQLIEKLHCG